MKICTILIRIILVMGMNLSFLHNLFTGQSLLILKWVSGIFLILFITIELIIFSIKQYKKTMLVEKWGRFLRDTQDIFYGDEPAENMELESNFTEKELKMLEKEGYLIKNNNNKYIVK